jgi:hypothetical protein
MATPANAYCRKAVCNGMVARRCTPAESDDCGAPLAWPEGRVGYDLEADAAGSAPVVARAFAAWAAADCGGGAHPDLRIARAAAARSRVRLDPAHAMDGRLAATDLVFDRGRGAIRRATMTFFGRELAPYGGRPPLALALHEAGHFLGIAHSSDPLAVMAGEVDDASLARDGLTTDDVAAVCAAYPPAAPAPSSPSGPCSVAGIAIGAAALAWIARRRG